MVTSSKILTVSYGTFSCTLEGFDDPFTTLQMVAEYFRKLAAEDRFFGSAPQVPDTDTLKRIAEEHSAYGIDAKVDENGIILRQKDQSSEHDAHAQTVDDILVFDSQRNVPSKANETAKEPAREPASPLTFFRSRRHESEPANIPEIEPELETVDVAIKDDPAPLQPEIIAEVEPEEFDEPEPRQKSVEETLAAIRQNVQSAETEAPDNDFDDKFDRAFGDTIVAQEPEPLILTPETAIVPEAAPLEEAFFEEPEEIEEPAPERDVFAERDAEFFAEPLRPSSLSDEDEAELEADLAVALAANEAENAAELPPVSAEIAPDVPEYSYEEQEEPRSKAEQLREQSDIALEDEALDRLLETTQSKMDKPEQQRRMNALDQLKAAVAATEADQKIRRTVVSKRKTEDEEAGDTADLAAYREDLRRAQENARLQGLKTAENRRPAKAPAAASVAAQAPLILVSEQRIAEAAPVSESFEINQPMHEVAEIDGNLALKPDVHAQPESQDEFGEIQGIPADAFSDATDFADFAERIGAFDLTDLLEASAAYTSIVEGRSRFSRAQVMSKIAKLNAGEAYSKEAGLRSFGKLLREGKILRVQDGQFGIAKSSRFSIASRSHG